MRPLTHPPITGTLLAAVLVLGTACGPAAVSSEVRVRGSDTMLLLNRRLAAAFMLAHPGLTVVVEGGGTAVGIEALVEGRAEIAAASRPISADEVAALHRRTGSLGLRHLVAQDALSVYLHPTNPVRDLSLDQLRAIFTGEIQRWSEVGGSDLPVVAIVRPPTSGTFAFFRDHVLGGRDYLGSAVTLHRTDQVVAMVASRPEAVGYGGVAYRAGVAQPAVDGAPPTPEAVRDGSYPLSRYLQLITIDRPRGPARTFIDWCQGPEGQRLVEEVGYIPLWLADGGAGGGP